MEKVQEHRHFCKLCSKSFPCGRSLGGHMRSHVINDLRTVQKNQEIKLKSVKKSVSDQNSNYTLRENPKKSSQFADVDEDDKLCQKCGKKFQSWKALFGHMKCHSNKLSNTIKEDSKSLIRANRKLEIDNQLDDETANPSKKKKRSRRGQNRNKGSSVASSISDIEQEEVALCLIMLSRDLGLENKGFCSVFESPDNNFDLSDVRSSPRTPKVEKNKGNDYFSSSRNKKLRTGNLEPMILGSESSRLDPITKYSIKKKKDNGNFECPICLKVFSSGQALGGHKRSHSIASADSESNPISTIPNRIIETRAFLDLNIPAPAEEEEETSGFESLWVNRNGNAHEILLE